MIKIGQATIYRPSSMRGSDSRNHGEFNALSFFISVAIFIQAAAVIFGVIGGAVETRRQSLQELYDTPAKKIGFLYGPFYLLGFWLFGKK